MNTRFAAAIALGVIAASSPPLKALQYQGPITITAGGTYTGNWQSLDPNKRRSDQRPAEQRFDRY